MGINFLVQLSCYSCRTALDIVLVDPHCICTNTKDASVDVYCSQPRTKQGRLLILPTLLVIELLQWVTLLCNISSVWNGTILKLQHCFCLVFLFLFSLVWDSYYTECPLYLFFILFHILLQWPSLNRQRTRESLQVISRNVKYSCSTYGK